MLIGSTKLLQENKVAFYIITVIRIASIVLTAADLSTVSTVFRTRLS